MALPTHRVEIFKSLGAGRWSNSYLLNVASMDEGEAVTLALVNFERHMHLDNVRFDYWRCSTMTVGDRVFRHEAINLNGIAAKGSAEMMPLFCTLRIDFATMDSDPGRKFYRLPVTEATAVDGIFGAAFLAAVQGTIDTHLVNSIALDNIVTSKGNVITGATPYGQIQERQLRRRKRPKVVTATVTP